MAASESLVAVVAGQQAAAEAIGVRRATVAHGDGDVRGDDEDDEDDEDGGAVRPDDDDERDAVDDGEHDGQHEAAEHMPWGGFLAAARRQAGALEKHVCQVSSTKSAAKIICA